MIKDRPFDGLVHEATAHFNRVITKFNRVERQPRDFGTGDPLTRTEIHLIVEVGENPLFNVTKLAGRLGVTKGAISQLLGKLLIKGYIRKLRSLDNDKETLLALSDKGKTAWTGHEQYHRDVLGSRLNNLTEERLRGFVDILARIESYADEYLKNEGSSSGNDLDIKQ
ncbi:MAG: MarR family transcriptional regulator [Thermodesulfobacteriota bacterium]